MPLLVANTHQNEVRINHAGAAFIRSAVEVAKAEPAGPCHHIGFVAVHLHLYAQIRAQLYTCLAIVLGRLLNTKYMLSNTHSCQHPAWQVSFLHCSWFSSLKKVRQIKKNDLHDLPQTAFVFGLKIKIPCFVASP